MKGHSGYNAVIRPFGNISDERNGEKAAFGKIYRKKNNLYRFAVLFDRIDLLHVDSFEDYVSDLAAFMEKIVMPADEKPVYIYSHSMGGAVTALYLAKYGDKVEKAVLSAPLFEPVTGMNRRVALFGVGIGKWFKGSPTKCNFSKDFDPKAAQRSTTDTSRVRFAHNMMMRCNDEHYQSTPMTYGWVYNSLLLRPKIISRKTAGSIRTPILLLSAEMDKVVKTDAHREFSEKCPSCKLVTVKNANHAMFSGDMSVLTEHINRVLEFYGSL